MGKRTDRGEERKGGKNKMKIIKSYEGAQVHMTKMPREKGNITNLLYHAQ